MRTKPPPKALRDLWAEIPSVNCKRECADCCGPIDLSKLERQLIEARSGRKLEVVGDCMDCSMLTNGLCSVYSIRPTICRLWGVVKAMQCPHGCEPERWVSDKEALEFLLRAMEIGDGEDGGTMHRLYEWLEQQTDDDFRAFGEYVKSGEDNRAEFLRQRRTK